MVKYQNTSNLENHYVTVGTDHKELPDRLSLLENTPTVDQSLEKHTYKGSIEVIVEHNVSDQGSKTDLSVPVDEIGLSARDCQVNVQLEVFLSYPIVTRIQGWR